MKYRSEMCAVILKGHETHFMQNLSTGESITFLDFRRVTSGRCLLRVRCVRGSLYVREYYGQGLSLGLAR